MRPDAGTRDPHRAVLGANLVRAVNGFRPPSPANVVRCPWCEASRGNACVVAGTGKRLMHVPAHHARYRAAGLEPPEIDPDLVAEARQAPWWAKS